jgi:hypothetical protein
VWAIVAIGERWAALALETKVEKDGVEGNSTESEEKLGAGSRSLDVMSAD